MTLRDLTPEKLTSTGVWAAIDPQTRRLAAESLYEDATARREADGAIASALRFREAKVRQLPVQRRVDYLLRSVHPDDSLASSLLLALHLGHRRPLLGSFLTRLGIPHEDGIIDPDHQLDPPDADQLGEAVGRLYETFPGPEVELYLASLVALDPDSWSDLPPLMRGQT